MAKTLKKILRVFTILLTLIALLAVPVYEESIMAVAKMVLTQVRIVEYTKVYQAQGQAT